VNERREVACGFLQRVKLAKGQRLPWRFCPIRCFQLYPVAVDHGQHDRQTKQGAKHDAVDEGEALVG
jgi:hypothetical protein